MDIEPPAGVKRLPSIEVDANASAVIDLWCSSVQAQAIVVNDTITVLPGAVTEQRSCDEQQQRADGDMLAALRDVTTWRRSDDLVEFIGPKTVRYRLPTH